MLSHSSVRTQFLLLLAVIAAGFTLFGLGAWRIQSEVRVGGPIYADIVRGKDLVADILPPPNYIIESYLTVLEMHDAAEGSETQALADRLKRLRAEYEKRHMFWQKEPLAEDIRVTFLKAAHAPALRFYDLAFSTFVPAALAGDRSRAAAVMPELKASYEEHRKAVDAVVEMASRGNESLEAAAASSLLQAGWMLLAIFGVSLGIGVALTYVLGNQLTSAFAKAHRSIDMLTGGKLGSAIKPVGGARELDTMLHALESMRQRWRDVVQALLQGSDNLAASSAQLAAATDQVSSSLDDQSQSTERIANAVADLTATIGAIAASAQNAEEIAREAGETAVNGACAMTSVAKEAADLATSVSESSGTVDALGERSREISAVVGVIREIADQTNLLALNAAIEAARAGETGRGFAVVADEVRKLAERTAQSTMQITAIIESVQAKTVEAVESMRAGMAQAHAGVKEADAVSARIREIRERTETLVAEIAEISTKLDAQSESGVAVSDGVSRIAVATEENSAAMRETRASSQTMREVAQQLQAAVRHFSV